MEMRKSNRLRERSRERIDRNTAVGNSITGTVTIYEEHDEDIKHDGRKIKLVHVPTSQK